MSRVFLVPHGADLKWPLLTVVETTNYKLVGDPFWILSIYTRHVSQSLTVFSLLFCSWDLVFMLQKPWRSVKVDLSDFDRLTKRHLI